MARSEADHIRAFSPKLNTLGPRSHKGMAAWYAVPLCRNCHRRRHTMREEDFYTSIGYPPPRLYAYLVHQVLSFFLKAPHIGPS